MNMRPPGSQRTLSTPGNVKRVRQAMLRILSRSARSYFFEENGLTVTVNPDRYINMINNFLEPELIRRRISRHNL